MQLLFIICRNLVLMKKKMDSAKTTEQPADVDWGAALLRDSAALKHIDPRWRHTITVRQVNASIIKKKKITHTHKGRQLCERLINKEPILKKLIQLQKLQYPTYSTRPPLYWLNLFLLDGALNYDYVGGSELNVSELSCLAQSWLTFPFYSTGRI